MDPFLNWQNVIASVHTNKKTASFWRLLFGMALKMWKCYLFQTIFSLQCLIFLFIYESEDFSSWQFMSKLQLFTNIFVFLFSSFFWNSGNFIVSAFQHWNEWFSRVTLSKPQNLVLYVRVSIEIKLIGSEILRPPY